MTSSRFSSFMQAPVVKVGSGESDQSSHAGRAPLEGPIDE
jgi:hypothetical protein